MINRLKNRPMKHQLIIISLLATSVALALTGLVLIADGINSFRRSLVNHLTVQAKIIGTNSTAAIVFNDPSDAHETLSALKATPNVFHAVIYTKDNNVFAEYHRNNIREKIHVPENHKDGYSFGINHLSVFQQIFLDKELIGRIHIHSDLKELYYHIARNTGTIIFLIALSSFVALALVVKLQKTITTPIMDLTRLMQTISKDRNYSLRASIQRKDEIGVLADGFNDMLEHIHSRDIALEQSNEQLLKELNERKRAEETIQYMAYYDSLTGLPNRSLFNDRLTQAIHRANRFQKKIAVMFLDLDRFKNINESLGHTIGDLLLKEIGERLKDSVRKENTVSRYGGDEFTIMFTDFNDMQDVAKIAQKILNIISQRLELKGNEIFITTSIGISLFPSDGTDAETLVKNADAAMYASKDYGRNNFQFYTSSMNSAILERMTLENLLRVAVKKNEFILHYQPILDIKSRLITGAEALVRWQHPDLGLIPPAQFIPIAEESGLIVIIGEYVLSNACYQAKLWQKSGFPNLDLSVNLSAKQFKQENLVEMIKRMLNSTGFDPKLLKLEITESTIMGDVAKISDILNKLHAIGIRLSIDDFGTGYSSLSYLKTFPIDAIKIDRSFLRGVPSDPNDIAIVNAITAMAKALNLKVIAEGIETEQQLEFLCSSDCDKGQGFLFSKPVSADEFTQLLKKGNPL